MERGTGKKYWVQHKLYFIIMHILDNTRYIKFITLVTVERKKQIYSTCYQALLPCYLFTNTEKWDKYGRS